MRKLSSFHPREEYTYRTPWYWLPVIDPAKSTLLRHWDLFILLMAYYVAFTIPYQVPM